MADRRCPEAVAALVDLSRLPGAWSCAVLLLLLTGCGKPETSPVAADIVRPALIREVGTADNGAKLRFPGRVRAERRAELSFSVPGFVTEFALNEGSRVKVGQIVARLEDGVFKAQLNAAQSEFERAKTDLERYQRLWESELAVARSEVDDRRARLEVARTQLATAQQNLDDAVIRAPFDGVITRRRLEAFANVQANQPIADLQDLRALEIVINVPERIVRNEYAQDVGQAVFEGQDALSVPLRLKSYAAEADPQTQTYEIVLALGSPPGGLKLLPGMSATVIPFAGTVKSSDAPLVVPLTAIAADATGDRSVWVVGAGGQVARRTVRTADVRGSDVVITSGLQPGERVVVAGVSALREDMKVRPLDER
ncbi:efflux transporter, RND family, MFP subunit [Methyloversatilis sp. RAC08]|uniref:efflux RND transporter periplasmic adaptor subunit n=1 Tax=Methyloversatilis sp. RAC08 TaxID=1842540 RepID=UPI000856D240|nr:efflux RND transporter periplasmic adaptor subunit [Methyloversatilis sp. RAC08]AOF82051.1 efflux transporter, RND family, MFP subunit [Methyloversatilis sp. RAC08]